ncbi:MAG: M1 family metallopeptidase [Planctomycetota bacterium]
MPHARPFSSLLLLLAAASSLPCQDPVVARVQPYPIDLPPEFEAAIAEGTRTRTGKPGEKYWTNRADYDLAIELDPVTARLTGKAKLTYHNRAPHEQKQLVLHLYQNLMKPDAERTRTVVPTDGFELGEVRIGGKAVRARPRDTRLTLNLPEPLPSGQSLTIEIDYAFTVPVAGTAPRMGHENDDVYYLGYWYPQFAVHDDVNGWVADRYRGNGEFYMGYGDYQIAVTVPQGYVVRATGELQNAAEVLTDKAIAQLQQAKTSKDVVHVIDEEDLEKGTQTRTHESGKLTWRFAAKDVRDAAVSIGRTYLWDATHAVVERKDGNERTCEIHAVYEKNSGDWIRAAEYARATIEWMSEQVYPYPWPHMTACEGIIGGGMEYPMMTICGGRRPQGVITHELTHMWFPMLLGSNEKRYAWQDEGFTSYWSSLCSASIAGRRAGSRGDVVSAAAQIASGGDEVCMRHGDSYGDDDFGFASYTKPAAVLAQLRGLIGDEKFVAGFRRYAADWAFKHPYPYDFFFTMSDVAMVDLESYFRTWLFETWALDHAIADVTVSDSETAVQVSDRGRAQHPCIVEATFEDGSKMRASIDMAHWENHRSATLKMPGKATSMVLDPDVNTIDVDRGNNSWKAPKVEK